MTERLERAREAEIQVLWRLSDSLSFSSSVSQWRRSAVARLLGLWVGMDICLL
jgi:uncharacterized membrane protein